MISSFLNNVVRGCSKTTQNNCNQLDQSQGCHLVDNSPVYLFDIGRGRPQCYFCGKNHSSSDCAKGRVLSTVPAKRLVGIELNPGPGQGKKTGGKRKSSELAAIDRAVERVVGRSQFNRGLAKAKLAVAKQTHQNKRRRGNAKSTDMYVPYFEEDLGPVTTPGAAFTTTNFIINPANTKTAPWFSGIAVKHEKYLSEECDFKYVEGSANALASTNTALGTVLLNATYDVADAGLATLTAMRNYGMEGKNRPCKEAAPSKNMTFKVKVNHNGGDEDGFRYCNFSTTSTPSYPANTSSHDYDVGVFVLATQGQQAACTVGSLRFCWSGWLRTKVQNTNGAQSIAAHFTGPTPTTANNFATAVLKTGNTITPVLGTNTITMPSVGEFLVLINITGTSSSGIVFSSMTNGALVTTFWSNNTSNTISSGTTTASNAQAFVVNVTAQNAVITMSPSTIVGGTSVDVVVVQLPSSVLTFLPPQELFQQMLELRRMVEHLQLHGSSHPHGVTFPNHLSSGIRNCSLDEEKGDPRVSESESDGDTVDVPQTHLTDSYLIRVGEALGVKRSVSSKK